MQTLTSLLPGHSETYTKELLRIAFKFAGEPQPDDLLKQIYQEAVANETVNKIKKSDQNK